MRKILAAAQTQKKAVRVASTIDSPTCQYGGAGRRARRISIKNGVAGGNSVSPTASGLDGLFNTAIHTKAGNIDTIITGIISDWASFSSLHAAPTAM